MYLFLFPKSLSTLSPLEGFFVFLMTYAEKLRFPKWQKKRLEIMQRDEFTCQLCKDTESPLHVHHKSYTASAEPWEYEDENFITYCEVCHAIVEDLKAEEGIKGFVSAKKTDNTEGIKSIYVSYVEGGRPCIAAYLYAIKTHEIKHVVSLGSESVLLIQDLHKQAELSTLR